LHPAITHVINFKIPANGLINNFNNPEHKPLVNPTAPFVDPFEHGSMHKL